MKSLVHKAANANCILFATYPVSSTEISAQISLYTAPGQIGTSCSYQATVSLFQGVVEVDMWILTSSRNEM